MSEDHITTTKSEDGSTHTTVTTGHGDRSGGGTGWIIGLVALALIALGIYFFADMSNSQAAKNNAVAEAAKDVGDAAQDVGDAAREAVKKN
jgi:hypothetical protein